MPASAMFDIVNVSNPGGKMKTYDVVGNICETLEHLETCEKSEKSEKYEQYEQYAKR